MAMPPALALAIIFLVGVDAGPGFARVDQAERPAMAAQAVVSGEKLNPGASEDSLKMLVADGEWVCKKKTGDSWGRAFRLKLTRDRKEIITPTGPIVPVEGNSAVFDAAVASAGGKTYNKFGLWEISRDILALKWYASWNQDATRLRALARAYRGENRFPGEIQIDPAVIDNLERGIDVRVIGAEDYLDGSFEIKVTNVERTHFSGEARSSRAPGRSNRGTQYYEYDLVSGKIKSVRSRTPSDARARANAYRPIRCDLLDRAR